MLHRCARVCLGAVTLLTLGSGCAGVYHRSVAFQGASATLQASQTRYTVVGLNLDQRPEARAWLILLPDGRDVELGKLSADEVASWNATWKARGADAGSAVYLIDDGGQVRRFYVTAPQYVHIGEWWTGSTGLDQSRGYTLSFFAGRLTGLGMTMTRDASGTWAPTLSRPTATGVKRVKMPMSDEDLRTLFDEPGKVREWRSS